MRLQKQNPPFPWYMFILYFIVALVVITGGFLYYHFQKQNLLSESQNELSAIADLKIRQITQWRFERLGNAGFLRDNRQVADIVEDYLTEKGNSVPENDLFHMFQSLTDNFDYNQIILLDTTGRVRFSYPEINEVRGNYPAVLITRAVRDRKIILSDLHRSEPDSSSHLDLLIPVINPEITTKQVIGIVDLIIDPSIVLYPLVQTWPTPSRSSETMIVRKDGDKVTFLNELRQSDTQGKELSLPVSSPDLVAAMAVRGITGTIDGVDYRNKHVVATMKKIPGTSWYMVAKTDRAEVLASLNKQMRMVLVILVLFMIALGMSMAFISWNQRARYYMQKYEAELERLALVKHFDYILKFANDIIFLVDKDLKIIEANDHALETYQYPRTEFIGMNLKDIRADSAMAELPQQIEFVEENESATFETLHKRKDGSVFPVEVSSRLVNIEGIKYFQTIGRDITERKLVEENLKASEERFRKIFEESPFCMLISSKNFEIERANESFCKMTGYDEPELRMLTFRDFTHEDHIQQDELGLLKLVAGEIPLYQTEKRYLRKDSSIVWGATTVSLIRNASSEVRYFLVMVEDITKRKAAELALEGSYSLLKATLESTADGILVVDTGGKVVEYNRKFAEMWNIPEDVLNTGKDDEVLAYVTDQLKDRDGFLYEIRRLYSNPEAVTYDLLEFRDGRFFERYSQPQKINDKTIGRVWSFRDISATKHAEADLIAAKEKAEESDSLKTAFLHNISHEIRTPMNAIIGFSNLLSEPGLDESEYKQYVDIINQSSSQLLSIINDIVDIANIESGQVRLNIASMNINEALNNLSEQYFYKSKEPAIPVSFHPGLTDEEAVVRTDRTKLIQVLSNLINNALKFTKDGKIDFGYTLVKNFIEFYVRDTGIGIPAEHLNKIFDRFYQVDGAGSRQYGGTGLGLSICKAYVELLGGTIRVESEVGKGTSFLFTVPYTNI